jgi:2-polyprenyl-6-methoxyphenol hydroxylase-like FAD-dependent oxidoreductase
MKRFPIGKGGRLDLWHDGGFTDLYTMKSSHHADAIVVGGGLAGLAISRQLHKAGIDIVTLERRPAFANEGFAINLPGNAIAALEEMGCGERIATLGRPTKRREYRDQRGRILFAIDEDAFWGQAYRPRCVKRSALMDLLREDLPDTVFRMSSQVEDIAADASAVTVTTSGGQDYTGRIAIGADGVHSRTRALVFPEAATRAAMLSPSSWRFLAPDPGIDCWTVWAGASGLFLLIPLGDGEVYGWASSDVDASAGLAHVFSQFPPEVRRTAAYLDAHPASVHHSPLEEVRMPAWGNERVVLIGDAAHATAPVWAQGGALAFEDANALSAILAGHTDWAQAATRFEAARRQRVAHVQAMTDKMSKAARLPTTIRNLLLPFVGPKSYRATYAPLRPGGAPP